MNPEISSLPIAPFLDEICENLKSSPSRALVLSAETGAGKSTAVPVALLNNFKGKILMLEPRRIAAAAIADRVSSLLGEETGKTAGYRLHLESKTSSETRLEVVTEAILIRMLQSDPLLENINVIVLDEFHERSIYSDLALAFLKETMQIRDDLYIIVMSATINYQSLAKYLGTESSSANVMKIPGRLFPVKIEYCDDKSLVSVVKSLVENLTNESFQNKPNISTHSKSILVFLPGIFEIRKTKAELEKLNLQSEILILHSSVSLAEQRKVLSPSKEAGIRIILSSSIAETSLTVPDVVAVVDSGFSRVNKIDLSTGMEKLVTERESIFSADQRAGRAGRVQAGICIRLWNKNDIRIQQNTPEILRSDLTQLVLECAAWGVSDKSKLSWLDSPSDAAWSKAEVLLENLDCVKSGKITEKGKAVLSLGLNPRLSCVALALYAEKKPLSLVTSFTEFSEANENRKKMFENDLFRRLSRLQIPKNLKRQNPFLAGYPDRLSKLIEKNSECAVYQFPSGRKAVLKHEILVKKNISNFPEWIIGIEASSGETTGKIYSFEMINENELTDFITEHFEMRQNFKFFFDDKNSLKCKKEEIYYFGQIPLKEKAVQVQDNEYAPAICDFLAKNDFLKLPLDSNNQTKLISPKTEAFLLRTEFFISHSKSEDIINIENHNSLAYKYLNLNKLTNDWLLPFLNSKILTPEIVYNAIYWFFNGNEIDKNVPTNIILPNGRKSKVIYTRTKSMKNMDFKTSEIKPTIEIIIQRIFGCFSTPKIMGEPILLKLLSPASRPLQITDDLEHFWTTTWPEICKEMKGRYPKHNWDYRTTVSE